MHKKYRNSARMTEKRSDISMIFAHGRQTLSPETPFASDFLSLFFHQETYEQNQEQQTGLIKRMPTGAEAGKN